MSEEMLVRHCSPTLAGLKTGSLFSCPCVSKDALRKSIRGWNQKLVKKGLCILPIRISDRRALIYVYRPKQLKKDLSRTPARAILEEYGYPWENPERCVMELISRLKGGGCFPHEIGLFLGYPPEDVRGFIENEAAGCKCTGYWKVYGDRQAAELLFEKYRKCTNTYCTLLRSGRNVEWLTVAV